MREVGAWLAVCLLLFGAVPQALAANFSFEFREAQHKARIDMNGPIDFGDADTLASILDRLEKPLMAPFEGKVILYLDSDGGIFEEAVALGRIIRARGIRTRVEAGAACFSACAILFMHGTMITYDEESEVSREIEPGGRLGFHAPYLTLPKDTSLKADPHLIEAAYGLALRQFADLLESGSNILSDELLVRMLRAGPSEIVPVSTYGDLMFWNIGLVAAPDPKTVSPDEVQLACRNLYDVSNGRRPSASLAAIRAAPREPVLVSHRKAGPSVFAVPVDDLTETDCVVALQKAPDRTIALSLVGFREAGTETAAEGEAPTRISPLFLHEAREAIPEPPPPPATAPGPVAANAP